MKADHSNPATPGTSVPAQSSDVADQSRIIEGLQRELADYRKRELLHRTSHEKLEAEVRIWSRAVEQSPVSIVITDITGRIEYVNPRFTQASGYTLSEVVGRNPRILKSGNLPEATYKQLWESITSGVEWRGELLNKTKSGDTFWEFVTISPLREASGQITHFLGIKEDITKRKRIDEALRISEENLRVIFNSVYDAIFIHELNGTVIDVNEKGLRMFGVTKDQALTLSMKDDLSSKENVLEDLPNYWKKAVLGDTQFFEWKARRPADDVTFDVEIFLRRLTLRGREAILAAVRDVTDRKRMQQQLFRAQRIDSISTVVGSIAHEFNNTLNNVLGFSNLIRKYIQDQTKVAKYSAAIEQSVMRSADLGNRLLAFARESKKESAPIDVGSLISELIVMSEKTLGPSITIEKKIEPQLMRVVGDSHELSQALLNLLVNAKEAIAAREDPKSPGSIFVAADNSVVSENLAPKLMLPAGSPCIVLRISDNGTGIPEDILERIFDPFFTTKERGRGAGLGLSIVFSTVRSHRGTITVDSEVGRGATFQIYIPALDPKKIQDDRIEGLLKSKKGVETILLVDDEAAMREIGTDILEGSGFKVLTASDGLEAVDIYRKKSKEISLVILDLVMPKMDGGQTFLELKKINPKVKSIFCTGFASDAIITQLLAEENIPAVQKPFRQEEFLHIVQETLSGVGV
ncbi:MAG: PAS domain S-box protein [Ignavibacteriales bacterium]|nr:PAS domain S-box protein [Ignavibacteriales bacterium]